MTWLLLQKIISWRWNQALKAIDRWEHLFQWARARALKVQRKSGRN